MRSFEIDYRSVELRGNHYEIGYELGRRSPPNLDFAEACARENAPADSQLPG